MNDRFKFRVWDKYNKVYFGGSYGVSYYLTDSEIDGDLYCRQCDGPFELSEDDDFIVEQCTGLKDKNGKLIYEGDILKPNGNTITKEVVYEDGSYWAKDTIYFHDKCHIFQKWIDECGYEVIGNIHEKESK